MVDGPADAARRTEAAISAHRLAAAATGRGRSSDCRPLPSGWWSSSIVGGLYLGGRIEPDWIGGERAVHPGRRSGSRWWSRSPRSCWPWSWLCSARWDGISSNPIWYGLASLYVSLVRGTPLLVQIFIIFFALPQLGIVLPPIPAGIIALAFNYGAYMTEIFRAGIQAVPRGQREAAGALGMPERLVLRRIVLPQAVRIVIPAIGNDFIAMIKDSSWSRPSPSRSCCGGPVRSARATSAASRRLLVAAARLLGAHHHLQLLPGAAGATLARATDDAIAGRRARAEPRRTWAR